MTGSPPQVRGKRGECGYKHIGHGDHPRRCGENVRKDETGKEKIGSPPQVRGKRKLSVRVPSRRGITPAGAGKTTDKKELRRRTWDHPRRCGENCRRKTHSETTRGSPPQVRGKQMNEIEKRQKLGITPAGAGKTVYDLQGAMHDEDHPRRCGENLRRLKRLYQALGSPPQVRGKPSGKSTDTATSRITPAGAGKTFWRTSGHMRLRDHPRRCGENARGNCRYLLETGSPPQVRGKPPCSSSGGFFERITPAGAGKTLKRSFRNQPFCS